MIFQAKMLLQEKISKQGRRLLVLTIQRSEIQDKRFCCTRDALAFAWLKPANILTRNLSERFSHKRDVDAVTCWHLQGSACWMVWVNASV